MRGFVRATGMVLAVLGGTILTIFMVAGTLAALSEPLRIPETILFYMGTAWPISLLGGLLLTIGLVTRAFVKPWPGYTLAQQE